MFDDELARIPTQPPRVGVLPGMRLGAAVPRATVTILVIFVAFFVVMPLAIMGIDPGAKLQLGPSRTAQGRVVSVADSSRCRQSGGHRLVYVFSPAGAGEFRGMSVVCEQSPYYSARGVMLEPFIR